MSTWALCLYFPALAVYVGIAVHEVITNRHAVFGDIVMMIFVGMLPVVNLVFLVLAVCLIYADKPIRKGT